MPNHQEPRSFGATTSTGAVPRDYSALPQEFKQSSRWVCYRLETRDGRPNCKVPYSPKTDKEASTTNPDTWCSVQEAVTAVHEGRFDGIGLIIAEPYIAADL